MYRHPLFPDRVFDSEQDFYNCNELDDDVVYDYLAKGYRQPQNEIEERWQKEGQELLKQGRGYDISFN